MNCIIDSFFFCLEFLVNSLVYSLPIFLVFLLIRRRLLNGDIYVSLFVGHGIYSLLLCLNIFFKFYSFPSISFLEHAPTFKCLNYIVAACLLYSPVYFLVSSIYYLLNAILKRKSSSISNTKVFSDLVMTYLRFLVITSVLIILSLLA